MDKQEKNSWDGFDLEDLTGHFSILSAADEEEILSGEAEQLDIGPESGDVPEHREEPLAEPTEEPEPFPAEADGEEEPERRSSLRGLFHKVIHTLEQEMEAKTPDDPSEETEQPVSPENETPSLQDPSDILQEEPYRRYDEMSYIQEGEELPETEGSPIPPKTEEALPGEEKPEAGEEDALPASGQNVGAENRGVVSGEEEEIPALLLEGAARSVRNLFSRIKGEGKTASAPASPKGPREQSNMPAASPAASTMADVVASTVDGVLKEQEGDRRRYRRRRIRTQKERGKLHRSNADRAVDTEDFSAPEPSMVEATMRQKRLERRLRKHGTIAAVLTLCCWTAMVFCPAGLLQRYIPAALLLGVLIAGAPVFVAGFARKQINCCTMASFTGAVTLLDALVPMTGRWEVPSMTGIAALSMTLAIWGEGWRCGALREGFRLVALGRPAYVVDLTPHGAVKQEGPSKGFYNRSVREDDASRQQRLFLPIVLTASLVFAVLASGGQGQWGSFLWCWSVILCAGSGMALPLIYSLPGYRLAKRMGVSGGALAGLYGAKKLSFSREMLVWDQDLFPPGSIRMGKVAVIGEDRRKVASYAGSLARAYRCGWTPVFETFLQNERGTEEHLDNFHVHEEGGISASIHGETAILGQAVLMRRMSVRLPKHLERKNALYLAIDGELVAIFPLEYRPADSVSWALYAMRRNRITPLLVTKDPNITPRNLKAMFGNDGGSVLLDLNERLNLSALRSGGNARPNALLYREGLAPYLEAVAGSRRLCRAVKWGNVISLLSCAAGTLLSFYLIFAGKMGMLSPIQVLIFTLLWTLPVVLMSLNVDRL